MRTLEALFKTGPERASGALDDPAEMLGAMHEWEHVFLRPRFGERYAVPDRPGLDPRRLDLYMLAVRLSLVAGPLRLLDSDFPDRAFMQGVADRNAKQALALLPSV